MVGRLDKQESEKFMRSFISSIWRQPPSDLTARIETCIRDARAHSGTTEPACIYFRADDVAVPGRQFFRMMELFWNYRVPLSLAVVPAWLTHARWNSLQDTGVRSSALWCWHQHGWRHVNHETTGKNQEFGSGRSRSEIKHDLLKGKQRLEKILGTHFFPVFTPPWNRCNLNTLELLKECGYLAVSRNHGALPPSPKKLPDLCVDVDLHTRKDTDPVSGWDRLFEVLKKDISSGQCGIMLHHQKMNAVAFDFLEMLLKNLKGSKNIRLVNFKDLVRLLKP
jgi:peptidoglycan/xylan/chitin deacetylase (PgdA/CDA1 family)